MGSSTHQWAKKKKKKKKEKEKFSSNENI